MGPCPKCSFTTMRGPFYRSPFGGKAECLVYLCGQCGYEMRTPTADQKRADQAQRELVATLAAMHAPTGKAST